MQTSVPPNVIVPRIIDLGRMSYADAYAEQVRRLGDVLAARETPTSAGGGFVLLVEHDPVITVTRRPHAGRHVLATPELLARHGVTLAETDRGGDVTYHGPGQIVAYAIVDLQRLRMGVHDHMRALEGAVIETCAAFGVAGERDPTATGVWVRGGAGRGLAKIAAMGVRVRKWATLHGLALNVRTNLAHFDLIVPCGLTGRPVTSLEAELGPACPPTDAVRRRLAQALADRFTGPKAGAASPPYA